jgi:hypothetical protein
MNNNTTLTPIDIHTQVERLIQKIMKLNAYLQKINRKEYNK